MEKGMGVIAEMRFGGLRSRIEMGYGSREIYALPVLLPDERCSLAHLL